MTSPLPATKTAIISACGKYRYALGRGMNAIKPARTATFIMLNPSTADADVDDPTIRRCMAFTREWKCDALQVVNLFGLRATHPSALKDAIDPYGPDNQGHLVSAISASRQSLHGHADDDLIVCAWGTHGVFGNQGRKVTQMIKDCGKRAFCLGVTNSGQPKHPLYVAGFTPLTSYPADLAA